MTFNFVRKLTSAFTTSLQFVLKAILLSLVKMEVEVMKLRLEREGGQWIFLSCACFLIIEQSLNIFRHAIH